MKKQLIIVPGGGDPKNKIYSKSFRIIRNEALRRGYSNVQIFSFPGHKSYSQNELYLNQDKSAEILLRYILDLEKAGVLYTIFARSYGCGVTLKALANKSLNNLESIKLWGPVPILSLYQVILGKEENIDKAKSKGCFLNKESFDSCMPFEIQLYKYSSPIPLMIGAGSLDKYSKPSFYKFLEDYIPTNKNISFSLINGLEHEVLKANNEYFNFIFK